MIFEILSWDLDRSWTASRCLSSSNSVFLDCVARGPEDGNFGFLAIFDNFDFWDFEISEIWLKFYIVTFGCEELSRERSARGPEDKFSEFWPFWAIFDIFD